MTIWQNSTAKRFAAFRHHIVIIRKKVKSRYSNTPAAFTAGVLL